MPIWRCRRVDGIDLEIGDHELVSLLGPSGVARQQHYGVLLGLNHMMAGNSLRSGECDRASPEKRDLGMVFQN
ncbi:MAG: hypothetical protein CM1200mP24_07150 [Gammaproteobacteria bacterium]|nr:MAG: hypothetical protein CM1200mP24_07150 [Gammaproteobacteria bacterium]